MLSSKLALTATTLMGVLGIGWLLMPDALGRYWKLAPGANLDYMGHRYGALLIGLGVIVWLGSNALNTRARRALMAGALVSLVLTTALSLYGALALGLNAWAPFGVELALSMGMTRAMFAKPDPVATESGGLESC